jgi:hypothetical protein
MLRSSLLFQSSPFAFSDDVSEPVAFFRAPQQAAAGAAVLLPACHVSPPDLSGGGAGLLPDHPVAVGIVAKGPRVTSDLPPTTRRGGVVTRQAWK